MTKKMQKKYIFLFFLEISSFQTSFTKSESLTNYNVFSNHSYHSIDLYFSIADLRHPTSPTHPTPNYHTPRFLEQLIPG